MILSGSSPRVRSRRYPAWTCPGWMRIISACAEQTSPTWPPSSDSGDHLRVCGADNNTENETNMRNGSSPRVRSRPEQPVLPDVHAGIISACAEQTSASPATGRRPWDHLRVCGADGHGLNASQNTLGSSPRVRSRQAPPIFNTIRARIISACAEQTLRRTFCLAPNGDHLRVCGADGPHGEGRLGEAGSSPRVRSRPSSTPAETARPGIISACAEQTRAYRVPSDCRQDHLRVCGADAQECSSSVGLRGSSPRVRSRLQAMCRAAIHMGIISACAEQT